MSLNTTAATCITNGTHSVNNTGKNTTCSQLQQQNQEIQGPSMPDEARVFLICLYVSIFLLGVTGNAVVCWVIGKKKELSGGDVFMVSLATADLLASLFVPILAIHDFLSNLRWHLAPVMCKILPAISPISLGASSWSLVLIAADRYRVIVTPMKRRLSKTMKLCGIAFTWAIAIGISIPYILTQKYQYHMGEYFCLEHSSVMTQRQKDYYVTSLLVIGWLLPIITVSALYGICIHKLRKSTFKSDSNISMKRREVENKKVTKMFILVSALFCICTLPYATLFATINFLLAYRRSEVDPQVLWTLNYSLFALSNMNSCLNPFVYAKRQPEIRSFVKLAWSKLRCRAVTQKDSRNARMKKYGVSGGNEMSTRESEVTKSSTIKNTVIGSFQNKAFNK